MSTGNASGSSISGGPTPWWQGGQPNKENGRSVLGNLQSQAPDGYKYDPVVGNYVRTPQSLGQDAGAIMGGLTSAGGGGQASPFTPPQAVTMPLESPTVQASLTPPRETGPRASADVANVKGPDMSAANAAEFARAKDQIGLTSRAALQGLSGAMAGRGVSGSGVEGRGQVSAINSGQQQLGDVSRQQAINNASLAEQNALASYQGDITQRAQNLQNDQAIFSGNITQRGQDLSAQQAAEAALVAQRGQDYSLRGQEYSGGIAQRGQDLSAQQGHDQLDLQRQELDQRRQAAALQALGGLSGQIGRF